MCYFGLACAFSLRSVLYLFIYIFVVVVVLLFSVFFGRRIWMLNEAKLGQVIHKLGEMGG